MNAWKRLLHELKFSSGSFDRHELDLPGEETDEPPAQAYETLSGLLRLESWIFVLLLPQSTVPEDLVSEIAPPLWLSVGTLGEEDGRA